VEGFQVSDPGDNKRIKRADYHEWMRRRWAARAEAAMAARRARHGDNRKGRQS
jgi:hypothetical protein